MCGDNSYSCNDIEFAAGCNRFGLDNPTPIITRRLASYGNDDTVEKMLERSAKQYQDEKFIDIENFGSISPDKSMLANGLVDSLAQMKANKLKVRDMEETIVMKRTGKKISGVQDIKMLDKIDNAKKFQSPANIVLARGVTIKIKDIPKNTTLKGRVVEQGRETNFENSLRGDKEIVVPSFGTTGALFARHLDILRNLKRRINLLKQAYDTQIDEERTWDQVASIIKTLEKGCSFLNFDDVHQSNRGTAIEADEEHKGKNFYEDPTLARDEIKLNDEIEEKRRIEEALRPQTIDMTSPKSGSLSKINSTSSVIPKSANADVIVEEVDLAREEDNEK